MMASAGLWMLLCVALLMLASGLPAWMLLIAVALLFSLGGLAAGIFTLPLLGAMPARLLGLLEHDLLQALPLYVFMGALLNRLPLADILFRVGSRAFAWTGAGGPLAGLGLGVLLAPMNGSVGASVAMLSSAVQPRLDAAGIAPERSAALTCLASTLGVVIPPSLVLILLGDAMLRAHTEAVNAGGALRDGARIINTQDVFHGALVPAALLLLLCALITWLIGRRPAARPAVPAISFGSAPSGRDWLIAILATVFIFALLTAVALGFLYAVEAAATGALALFCFGLGSRSLSRQLLKSVLRDTMAVSGALFALLVAATMFTLVLRAFGSDRWIAAQLLSLGNHPWLVLAAVLGIVAACAFVLDAFEMIFVVIPLVMPPLLVQFPDAVWVAVLTLLILQASFLLPPFGYALMMIRSRSARTLDTGKLVRALLPYLLAQLLVLAVVVLWPNLLWRDPAMSATPRSSPLPAASESLEDMLNRQQVPAPAPNEAAPVIR